MGRTTSRIRWRPSRRTSTRSPGFTFVAGLAPAPFTSTCPPWQAVVASERVFVIRTAHSHRSTRVVSVASGTRPIVARSGIDVRLG